MEVADYKELSAADLRQEDMTCESSITVEIPVYGLENGEWTMIDVNAGDILLFAFDEASNPVWAVRVVAAEISVPEEPEPPTEEPTVPEESEPPTEAPDPTEPEQPTEIPTEPEQPSEPSMPTEPVPEDPTMPSQPGGSENPGSGEMPSNPGGTDIPSNPGGNFPSGGGSWGGMNGTGTVGGTGSMSGMGGMNGDFMMEPEPEDELYAMDMAQIAAVVPQGTMTVEITVDELDICALKPGMTAEVKINALGGEKFTAAITSISNTGTNNGGNSKFMVELTMERRENMLVGMNASANLVLNTTEDALTVPAEALVEDGTRTLVYTGYDEENACLTGPVEVITGVSDGKSIQILEGLSDGDTYYYAYYDTLEISNTPDFGGGMMFGR